MAGPGFQSQPQGPHYILSPVAQMSPAEPVSLKVQTQGIDRSPGCVGADVGGQSPREDWMRCGQDAQRELAATLEACLRQKEDGESGRPHSSGTSRPQRGLNEVDDMMCSDITPDLP